MCMCLHERHFRLYKNKHLCDGLHRADVGVRPEQDMLQLSLLLVDALHGETLLILLWLAQGLVLKQRLRRRLREHTH